MSASTTVPGSSTSAYTTPAFWERLWRMSGIHFVVFIVIAYAVYGYQPQAGSAVDALVAFYDGNRVRILVAELAVIDRQWGSIFLLDGAMDSAQSYKSDGESIVRIRVQRNPGDLNRIAAENEGL